MVEQFVAEMTKLRRWRRLPGTLSESRKIRVEFLDEEGKVIVEFVILGRSLIVAEKDDLLLEADWPEGLAWAIEVLEGKGKVNK